MPRLRWARAALLLAAAAVVRGAAGGPALLAAQDVAFTVRPSATPCLAVRVRAEQGSRAITCIAPGTAVTGVAAAPYWRRVVLADGRAGWAAKKFLEPRGPALAADTTRDDAWLEIHVVDVGQGDGIWIHTFDDGVPGNGWYEGRNLVIDGGPDASDARNEFLRYLRARAHAGAIIDAMIVTHPHDDHYSGALGVLRHFEVRTYFDPGYPKDGVTWARFLAAVAAETAEGRRAELRIGRESFGTLDLGAEISAEFLWAWPGDAEGLGRENTVENNASIVLKLTYGTQSILLMGDAEGKDRGGDPDEPKYVEARLLAEHGPAALRAAVLKLGHHGSETSSTWPFIRAVDPSIVIASSGRRPYGGRFLPDSTTLRRYCDHNAAIRIYRTDQDDAAERRSAATDADGDHVVIRTNGRVTLVDAWSAGTRIVPTACTP